MSRREEIEQRSQTADESEDLPTLEHTHGELERRSSGGHAKLEPGTKFCPECGSRASGTDVMSMVA